MWSPTEVHICIFGAKGLKLKGKNGTNNAFVRGRMNQVVSNAQSQRSSVANNNDLSSKFIFDTHVVENAESHVKWMTEGDLPIPTKGSSSTTELTFTIYHKSSDLFKEFLGTVSLPIEEFSTTRPVRKWYPLQCKPGQGKTGYRGELEIETSLVLEKSPARVLTSVSLPV